MSNPVARQKPEEWKKTENGVIEAFTEGELTVEKMLD